MAQKLLSFLYASGNDSTAAAGSSGSEWKYVPIRRTAAADDDDRTNPDLAAADDDGAGPDDGASDGFHFMPPDIDGAIF
ncbi:hypothetical protein [Acuticoccus sediminis]|uniref:hypothetical protein n=1 Tax=Acuticoccus sediminis TaxID=2184697 RepID=UPI001CFCD239|nr:hypothetical protein [Acuticoccus sediminis]